MKKMTAAAILLAAFSGAVNAQSVYGKVGLFGAGIGYAHGINDNLAVRADITTIGNYSKDGTSDKFDYRGSFKFDQTSIYGDWFPFSGTFSLTGGVNFRQAKLSADARPNQAGTVTVGDTVVNFGAGDTLTAKIEMPSVAPYLGIGWGHNVSAKKSGISFFADIGFSFGKPKVSLDANESFLAKLNTASNGKAQKEINKQVKSIKEDSNKIKVFPQIYLGVSYKF